MRTLDDELKKAGFEKETQENAKKALRGIRRKIRSPSCKFCKRPVFFKPVTENGHTRHIAYNEDNVEHWKSCPYSPFYQKKSSLKMVRKALVFLLLKTDIDLQGDIGLDMDEMEVAHAILEREFKSVKVSGSVGKVIEAPAESDVEDFIKDVKKEESAKIEDELSFDPIPTDPVGDPDEEIAPSEEEIKKEKVLGSDLR